MKSKAIATAIVLFGFVLFAEAQNGVTGLGVAENLETINSNTNQYKEMKTVYDFSVKDRKGKQVSIKEYANEVLLIVNTATKCGFTPQYDELEKLYKKYHSQGFEILDFPCNQFGQQAPGTDESIHEFCKLNFGTDFPRFKKVKVNGDDADPLFKFLKEQKGFAGWDESNPLSPILDKMLSEQDADYKQKPDIKWNFTKFLINKKGQVVARYEPTTPIDQIAKDIEPLLGE
jgi:glutathione peroxidase